MPRLLLLALVVSTFVACTGDDGSPPSAGASDGAPTDQADTGDPASDASAGAAAEPTRQAFQASIDDPVYVSLVLDCLYGENEARSCEQLEAAGLQADDAYGLGNALAQTPSEALRTDCLGGVALACGELNTRVATAVADGTGRDDLLCLFHDAVRTGAGGSDLDYFHLAALLGSDAPPGVVDGIASLTADRTDAAALAAVAGYLDPVCAAAAAEPAG